MNVVASAENMSPQQIEERLAAKSVVYIPLGSLEFHGPHLPIGLDALTAHGICLAAAHTHGGIVLPPLFHAVGGEHSDYPWTIMSQSPEAIETLLAVTFARLCDMGVRRAVVLSGHFAEEQRDLITRAAQRWTKVPSTLSVIARTLGQVPEPPVMPDHAGRFESLLMHAISSDLVRVEQLPNPFDNPVPAGEDPYGPDRHRRSHPLHGVFGADPRTLDIESAEPLFNHVVAWVASLGDSA